MIQVLVRQKDIPHVLPLQAGQFELPQDRISAAAVDHEMSVTIRQDEAGVVAFGDLSISRTKNRYFHKNVPLSFYSSSHFRNSCTQVSQNSQVWDPGPS